MTRAQIDDTVALMRAAGRTTIAISLTEWREYMSGEPRSSSDPDERAARIEELEIAVRAALSFMQQRYDNDGRYSVGWAEIQDGHAKMVIAALRGALRPKR